MNREEAKGIIEHFEIVKAYAEGKTIQKYRSLFSRSHGKYVSGWEDTDGPQFFKGAMYRVKPEPMEVQLIVTESGQIGTVDVLGGPYSKDRLVTFREVLPEDKS